MSVYSSPFTQEIEVCLSGTMDIKRGSYKMTKRDKQRMIKAVWVIRETCENQKTCKGCSLADMCAGAKDRLFYFSPPKTWHIWTAQEG